MTGKEKLLARIKQLVASRRYRIAVHAVRHMIEEGFTEAHVLAAFHGKCKLIENYPDENRCLVLGSFSFSRTMRSPLHLVCDYSIVGLVDIVTAYIPQRPWWETPTKRGGKR